MADRKPSEDLKEGMALLFRAARGMARGLDNGAVEKTVTSGAKELVRVISNVGRTLGAEIGKNLGNLGGSPTPPKSDDRPAGPGKPPP